MAALGAGGSGFVVAVVVIDGRGVPVDVDLLALGTFYGDGFRGHAVAFYVLGLLNTCFNNRPSRTARPERIKLMPIMEGVSSVSFRKRVLSKRALRGTRKETREVLTTPMVGRRLK